MTVPLLSAPAPALAPTGNELDEPLAAVELRLAALAEALRARDSAAIDCHANELHRALAHAVQRFSQAARRGSVAPELRLRLVHASGRVAAQRESLARATAALDRAMDVLMPREAPAVYGAHGGAERATRSGVITA